MSTKIKPPKVLIAGASGFLGLNMFEEFIDNAVCLDREPAAHVQHEVNLQHVWPTVSKVSAVICAVNGHHTSIDPQDPSAEVAVVRRGIEYAVDAGAKLFIHFSSASVYGNTLTPVAENQTHGIVNPYGLSKRRTEYALKLLGTKYRRQVKIVSLRLFNPIGMHQSPSTFPYKFMRNILTGKSTPILLHAMHSEYKRAYTPVANLRSFVSYLVNNPERIRTGFTVYNFGSERSIEPVELGLVFRRVLKKWDLDDIAIHGELSTEINRRLVSAPNNTKIAADFPLWKPKVFDLMPSAYDVMTTVFDDLSIEQNIKNAMAIYAPT